MKAGRRQIMETIKQDYIERQVFFTCTLNNTILIYILNTYIISCGHSRIVSLASKKWAAYSLMLHSHLEDEN